MEKGDQHDYGRGINGVGSDWNNSSWVTGFKNRQDELQRQKCYADDQRWISNFRKKRAAAEGSRSSADYVGGNRQTAFSSRTGATIHHGSKGFRFFIFSVLVALIAIPMALNYFTHSLHPRPHRAFARVKSAPSAVTHDAFIDHLVVDGGNGPKKVRQSEGGHAPLSDAP